MPPHAPPDLAALTHRPGPGPHLATTLVDGRRVSTLADLPPLPDRLLFVGLNPSPVSVDAGHYHQGRLGRQFWRRLMDAEILPADTPLETADDALVAAGHGITDLIKDPTPRDVATDAQLTAGVGPLWQKVAIWRPAAVVFVYKRAAQVLARRPIPERWGMLAGVALAGRPCLLMPGPYRPAAEVREAIEFFRSLGVILPEVRVAVLVTAQQPLTPHGSVRLMVRAGPGGPGERGPVAR